MDAYLDASHQPMQREEREEESQLEHQCEPILLLHC